MSDPVSQAELDRLRQSAKSLEHTMTLRHCAADLWLHVADKNAMSQAVGMPEVEYEFTPRDSGGSVTLVRTTMLGMMPAKYWEIPYEWIPPTYSAVERIYLEGPLKYLGAAWYFADRPEGGCDLTIRLSYVPRFAWMPVKPVLQNLLRKMVGYHLQLDADLPERHELGFEAFMRAPDGTTRAAIEPLRAAWEHLMPDHPVAEKLAEFLHLAPENKLIKLRPFEIAAFYDLPKMDVLRFCLLATRAGFLDLSWDLLCPSCRGGEPNPSLAYLDAEAHCEVCNIEYDANLDHNVEVTFRPTPRVRAVDGKAFCLISPAGMPHVWAQLNLDPGQTREVTLHLPAGEYQLRSLSAKGRLHLQVSADAPDATLDLTLGETLTGNVPATVGENPTVILRNPRDLRQAIKFEHQRHRIHAASAALVTTLQDFRDQFAAEVLRPGVRLGVSNLAILFSDLKDSTKLYEHQGDAAAFALVQEHFDIMQRIIARHQGAVVKTIGDAIMAAFTHNADAVAAALEILRAFADYNQSHDTPIIIKLGVHKGACIALNLNDKLDYFGSTVNRSARTQSQSQGEDLVVSKELMEDPEVQALLEPHAPEPFTAELKGIREAQQLYRVVL